MLYRASVWFLCCLWQSSASPTHLFHCSHIDCHPVFLNWASKSPAQSLCSCFTFDRKMNSSLYLFLDSASVISEQFSPGVLYII
jgi:hypothetical protein